MANSGCLCPVIVAGRRGGRLGVVNLLLIICYGVVAHPSISCFRWRCGGGRSRPPALAGGGAKLQSCEGNFLLLRLFPRNIPLLNYSNYATSTGPTGPHPPS